MNRWEGREKWTRSAGVVDKAQGVRWDCHFHIGFKFMHRDDQSPETDETMIRIG